jgi:LmbE family N-acetylglucosaminyl deacetylase
MTEQEAPLAPMPGDWRRALAIVAHPDDMEYGASAAVAGWTGEGREVAYLMVTRGEAGIDDLPPAECAEVREHEQVASAAVVGVETVNFLDHGDGTIAEGERLRRDLAAAIRRHRPELVITLNHRDTSYGGGWNSADHRAVGRSVLDAVADAANRWIFPDLIKEELAPWHGVRWVAVAGSPHVTHGVDVTATVDRAVASLAEHRTYLTTLARQQADADGGPPSPERQARAFVEGATAEAGRRFGTAAAVLFELVAM